MNYWLFTWNPTKYKWEEDDYDKVIKSTHSNRPYRSNWSTHSRKEVTVGDRFYMSALGRGKKNGIVASGTIKSIPYFGETWTGLPGVMSYVDVDFEVVLDYRTEDLLSLDELRTRFPNQQWNPTASGIRIKQDYCDELDMVWAEFLSVTSGKPQLVSDELLKEVIRKRSEKRNDAKLVRTTQFQRDPLIAEYAKRRAKGVCQLCDMSAPFNTPNGQPYLESHHVIWLSKGGEDSINNVIALCPNCHRKMHIVDNPSDVDILKDKLNNV